MVQIDAPRPGGRPAAGPALRIASLVLDNPFILAPLAGLGNFPFRRLAKEAGAGLTFSEMVSAAALACRGRAALKLLESDPALEKPFGVQLFGKDPDQMAEAARIAVDHGADLIDLNLGCPARKVISSGHGSALLKDLPTVRKIIRALVRAVPVPVTLKTRPAFAPGVGETVFDLLPLAVDEGAAAITLHPRMTSEGFAGEADWRLVARLAEKSPVPIIGSGDIRGPREALDKLRRYGAAGVMIGRGAKGRPWLFRQCLALWRGEEIPAVTLEERLETAERHARLLYGSVGPKAPFMLRTVLMWYTKGLRGAAEFRARLCREEDLETQLDLLAQCVRRHREEAGDAPIDDWGGAPAKGEFSELS
ncbi:MAG: tRNA-dihydrouridine synthase [Candidatus Adiutrix sp.]|jgi:nifR3 family TIM-barrel protein|nr:tRNA-dihydrouridine synthase [Candidatus Adiutrix sp.]